MKIRTVAVAGLVTLALSGCNGHPEQGATDASESPRISSVDDSLSLSPPAGWSVVPDTQQDPIVIVAQGNDPIEQLIVTHASGTSGAYDNALYTVTGLTSNGMECSPATLGEHQMFDCGSDFEGAEVHRLFIAIEGRNDDSFLLLVQTPADSQEEALAVATPVVESIKVS